jgi:DNA-binding response OmpR family regulator
MNASDAPPALPPSLLLLEDDPVSAEFMRMALAALPARVEHAASLAEARARVADRGGVPHALWLFDARLPDGAGAALLAELRAGGHRTPALAHTAEPRPEERAALLAAGFRDVLIKPLGVDALQAAVRRALGDDTTLVGEIDPSPMDAQGATPIWDDAVALRALNGNAAHVTAMRGLFLQELETTAMQVSAAVTAGDAATLGEALHRLRAACGFVGAARLAAAAEALRETPTSPAAVAQFENAARDTLSFPT